MGMETQLGLSSSLPSSPSSPSSSSSSSSLLINPNKTSKKYDVFLNFRGEDTRTNFMGHLRVALNEKNIETFIDDDELERGRYISPQLLQAIENSNCSIVIISPNYASSTWCLDELVKILDCMTKKGQIVIPIFYHVDPSDVRKQTGSFGEAFCKHQLNLKDEMERVNSWRTALKNVTNLAGLDSRNYRDDATFIRDIVADVSLKVGSRASKRDSFLPKFKSTLFCIVSVLLFYFVFAPLLGLFFFKVFAPFMGRVLGFEK